MDHASSSSPSVRSTGSSPRYSPISPLLSPESNSSSSSSSGAGSVIVYDSESSEDWGSSADELEALESFFRKTSCMRYFLKWNVCVDQSIRNGQDHRIQCFRLSRALRNCVRLA